MLEITPPNPSTTSSVRIQVAGSGCNPAFTFQQEDFAIEVRETINCDCVALPPPYAFAANLGQLEAGAYTVHRSIFSAPMSAQSQCETELISSTTHQFAVNQATLPPLVFVPISGTAAVGLALAVVICAAIFLRLRSGA